MKHTYGMTAAALAITAATAFAGGAQAASIEFTIIESRFFDAVGGNVLSIAPAGGLFGDPSTIRWGQDGLALASASGYQFEAASTPFDELPDTVFDLGLFSHFNNPINAGTAIDAVSFEVRGDINVVDNGNTTNVGMRTFAFNILHDETSNSAAGNNPANCARQPSISVCDDFVEINTAVGSDVFVVDGSTFTLNILGFSQDIADANNGIFSPIFASPEGGTNTRILAATFSQDLPTIPLPAAGWLLLAGIGALGALRRVRKT